MGRGWGERERAGEYRHSVGAKSAAGGLQFTKGDLGGRGLDLEPRSAAVRLPRVLYPAHALAAAANADEGFGEARHAEIHPEKSELLPKGATE
ncbi:MAG: hypothetical protein O7A09_04655, partial [Proteobacteria bacterium]|nr:hypothetical protein [Pseudomonadota bacterium]